MGTEPTLKSLAAEAASYLERIERTSTGEEIVHLKPDRPVWVADLVRKAHGDMLPDDWRYRSIEECLDALADCGDEDGAREQLEADVYTSDLTAWLHSRNDRLAYMYSGESEYGAAKDEFSRLQLGQLMEKYEVFDLIISFLRDRLDA